MAKLSFRHLSPTEFESFCFDLLDELGFVNVDWRKGTPKTTSPADRGRDIVCQEIRTAPDKSVHLDTWFVECKHHTKGVPPTDVQNVLAWAEAERPHVALIIASGFLSNPAKDYLHQYQRNRKPPYRIATWEQPQLQKLTMRKLKLLRKYELTDTPLRSIKTILDAEQELFDKIWYNRHVVLMEKVRGDEASIDPAVLKIARTAAERKRKEYGAKNLGPWDDFEWGMLNGKLSALRWVLGEEWDFLDT